MPRPLFALVVLSLTLIGCAGDAPAPTSGTAGQRVAPAAQATGHAPVGYVPGSHEDWCAGHGVPESQCTRCNPALIPAFKATGDWCAEHQLPESQCLKCNPGLKIERPPKTTAQALGHD